MNKNLSIGLIIGALIIGAALGYYLGYDHGWEKAVNTTANEPSANEQANNAASNQPVANQANNTNSAGNGEIPFHQEARLGYFGTLTLTGYLDVQKRVCNPGDMCGETVDYASFVFTKTSSEAIKEFTGVNEGNSFVAGDRVGIGCYQKDKNRIYSINDADSGVIESTITGSDLSALLKSTKNNQVQLKMTREIYTGGRGAPDCYSHFRNFDVL